ncbi:MAG: sensor histidine kinase [Thermoanaerobaculia bacterium]
MLALQCDVEGRVLTVVRDDLGIVLHAAAGSPRFVDLVDEGSRDKAGALLDLMRTEHAAFDWELVVPAGGRNEVLHFAGLRAGEQLVVIGSTTRAGLDDCSEELLRMSNEQANQLRMALKNLDTARRAAPEHASGLYEELMRVNNELAALQRELARKNAELARLNELKNQFLGMAAHDLRSPLAVIRTYADFLNEDLADAMNAEQKEFISIIAGSSDFMLRLIEDLLDVSAIEAGRLELELVETDLVPVVEHNVARSRMVAERKGIELKLELSGPIPRVNADARRIEQVLTNLISNAIKYSAPGTTVTVAMNSIEGAVSIAVRDQGQGIPEDEVAQLFRPFGRTSVRGTAGEKSTGLGLLIVRKIVEGHRGSVAVTSRVGEGSEFRVTIPAA